MSEEKTRSEFNQYFIDEEGIDEQFDADCGCTFIITGGDQIILERCDDHTASIVYDRDGDALVASFK